MGKNFAHLFLFEFAIMNNDMLLHEDQIESIVLWGNIEEAKMHINSKNVNSFMQGDILRFACAWGSNHLLPYLISIGANVNYENSEGFTPLLGAINNANVEAMQLLIDHGANVKHVTKNGYNCLHCLSGINDDHDFSIGLNIIKKNTTEEEFNELINCKNDIGETPIDYFAHRDDLKR